MREGEWQETLPFIYLFIYKANRCSAAHDHFISLVRTGLTVKIPVKSLSESWRQ